MEKQQSRMSRFMLRKVAFGATVGGALFFMLAGIIFWGGFNTAMDVTNTMTFCTSCHEMRDNVYAEFIGTSHHLSGSGVGASCTDCHVPRPWIHMTIRKIAATRELYHKALGTVNTPEKFDERRLIMASRVWNSMKRSDSRECRNCHDWNAMNPEFQSARARNQHLFAMEQGHTCIDCHMGIAHKDVHVRLSEEELELLTAPVARHRRDVPQTFLAGLARAEAAELAAEEERAAEAQRERERRQAEQRRAAESATTPAAAAAAPGSAAGFGIDWNAVADREITLFYPGQASMEWTLVGSMHGGARPFRAGDTCLSCHGRETADMGLKIVSGQTAETTPIEGKRPAIPVTLQATHDGEHLYLRFQWEATDHVPVPFAAGGRMDPDNAVKLAVMLSTDKPEYTAQAGCWATCHHDLNGMPAHPENPATSGLPLDFSTGVTKYLKASRTSVEEQGRRGAVLGGWQNLQDADTLRQLLADGYFKDLLRVNSDGSTEDGHVLEQRVMSGGQGFAAEIAQSGGYWTAVLKRRLVSDSPGDVSLKSGEIYNFSFAIHDDYADGRFHHVSLGYRLALDNPDVQLNVVRQ